MNDSPSALRPEAGPVPFDSLTISQRNAMKAIAEVLKEATAQAAKSTKSKDRDGLVDADRVSRLFFVSGEPGSGKSSLYLTLRAILGKEKRYDDIRKEYQSTDLGLSGLDGATRWLEQIDLEVAGDTGENLLAAVLVRIFAAIDNASGIASKNCQDAMTQLDDLANDIGIAWDGNLKARGGSLDPQSYSLEVMNAQRARLGTNKRLREALETLLEEKCYDCKGETLFVLPIDDFYLKPAASLELLRLLRMVSVPRLFFLIMGDIKTMEALFFEKALADWTAVAGPQVFASLKERKDQDVLPRAREMKTRYLRKLLPAAQRATIEMMAWDEALRYKPTVANSSGSFPELYSLLSKVSICKENESNDAHCNLLNYLVAPKYDEKRPKTDIQKTANKFREAYTALQILDTTPREVLDIWMCLRELKNDEQRRDKEAPAYLRIVLEFAQFAIEEQSFLTEKHQDLLRRVLPETHERGPVETQRIYVKQKDIPEIEDSPKELVFVRKHRRWEIHVTPADVKVGGCPGSRDSGSGFNSEKNKGDLFVDLPPRPVAWIILLHDLSWRWDQESITTNLVHELLDSLRKPKNDRPCLEDPGWAWYKDQEKWSHFPFLKLDTFRQLDRFLIVWNDVIPSPPSNALNLDSLVSCWVFAAWIAEGPEDRYENFVNKELPILETSTEENHEKMKGFEEFKKALLDKHPVFKKFANGKQQ